MPQAAVIENSPDIRDRVADLKNQIMAVQEQLQALLRAAGGLQVILPELHDAASGRIDAHKMAAYMGVPLKRLAEGLQLHYKAIHRNPSAEFFQPALKPVNLNIAVEVLAKNDLRL